MKVKGMFEIKDVDVNELLNEIDPQDIIDYVIENDLLETKKSQYDTMMAIVRYKQLEILREKEIQGFSGWDKGLPLKGTLTRIGGQVLDAMSCSDNKQLERKLIHIINLASFLVYHIEISTDR